MLGKRALKRLVGRRVKISLFLSVIFVATLFLTFTAFADDIEKNSDKNSYHSVELLTTDAHEGELVQKEEYDDEGANAVVRPDSEVVESGKLFFNEDNVACLAQVDFQSVRNEEDGTIVITVPYDEYSARALNTNRPYLAVSRQGDRLDEPDERLGIVEIDGTNEIDALILEDAQLVNNGASIEFRGYVAGAKDFNDLFYATGTITTSISDEEMNQAWNQLVQDLEEQAEDSDYQFAVVNLPELNSETADIWASSIDGDLEMVLHKWSESSDKIVDDDSDPSWLVKHFHYDYSKYKGFFEDVRPMSDPTQSSYKDFSGSTFLDSWVIAAPFLIRGS